MEFDNAPASDRGKKQTKEYRVMKKFVGLAVTFAALGMSAAAQTGTVPLDSGTAPSGFTNSSITQSNGNVGVGTTSPTQLLTVNGSIATGNPGTGLYLRTAPSGQYNTTLSSSLLYEGLVSGNGTSATPWGLNLMTVPWTWGGDPMTFHAGMYTWRTNSNGSGPEVAAMTLLGGNLGIGTTSPGAKLEVDGNVKLTSGSGASVTFADGTVQSTAWTGSLCGGDYAEAVDVSGERTHYEPGDVLVIDTNHPGKFLKSDEPYSTDVTGIYSTKPGVIGRRQKADTAAAKLEVPMAMIGIVPVKVSAENGSIKPGDFLVTSSMPGRAMKGTDRSRLFGAVVGKALGSLDKGIGVVEAVVSLQ